MPIPYSFHVGGRVVLFALAGSLIVGIGFGLVAALVAARPGVTALHAGVRVSGTVATACLRGLLVASQMALSLVLLVGAGLMIRTFVELSRVDPGFEPDRVVTMRLSLPDIQYRYADQWQKIARFYSDLERNVQALPGVEAAGATINAPLSGFASRPRPYSFVDVDGEVEWQTLNVRDKPRPKPADCCSGRGSHETGLTPTTLSINLKGSQILRSNRVVLGTLVA